MNDINSRSESFQRVSVIITSYNHAKFIEQSIMSVLNQSYGNVELIVVDDGSTDGSPMIIKDLQLKHSFSFFEQKNGGCASAVNHGLRYATGEYIGFLASDDYYHPEKISQQLAYYTQNPHFGFIHAGAVTVNQNGVEISKTDFAKVTWDNARIFETLMEDCFVSAQTVMTKRTVLDSVGCFDESIEIEDWDLWLRIAKYYEVGFQRQHFSYYRQHGSNTYFSRNRQKVLRMCKAEKSILDKWVADPHYKKVIEMRKLKWFYRLSQVSRIDALPYFFPALRYFYNHLFYKGLLFFFFGDKLIQNLRAFRD